jgi:hypothetical protein
MSLVGLVLVLALAPPAFQRRLKGSHEAKTASTLVWPESGVSSELNADDPILCRACGSRITSVAAMIAVSGSHRHRFTNPAGVTYQIGCFSAAEGCLVYGEPTQEHTWFKGYDWSFAFCQRCHHHLGWHYQSSGVSFFGLILDNLIEKTRTH